MGATFIDDDLELAPVLLGTYLLEVGLVELGQGDLHGNNGLPSMLQRQYLDTLRHVKIKNN